MMAIDLSDLHLEMSNPPTPEEEMAEAKAWGFDKVEDLYAAMAEAHTEYEKEQHHA